MSRTTYTHTLHTNVQPYGSTCVATANSTSLLVVSAIFSLSMTSLTVAASVNGRFIGHPVTVYPSQMPASCDMCSSVSDPTRMPPPRFRPPPWSSGEMRIWPSKSRSKSLSARDALRLNGVCCLARFLTMASIASLSTAAPRRS